VTLSRISSFAALAAHWQPKHVALYLAVAASATLLALLTTAQAGFALAYEGVQVPWTGLLKARLADWYICALFMPLLIWLARRFPVDRAHWARSLPLHVLASVPIALAKEALFVAVGNWFRPGAFELADILAEDLSHEVIAVWALSGLAHALAFHERFAQPEKAPSGRIAVRTRSGHRLLSPEDIEWIESHGNYARLTTSEGRFLLRETIAALERRLGSSFARIHRRIIVRVDRIARIEPRSHSEYWLHLASGERLGSSRTYARVVRALKLRSSFHSDA
jgi:DNA-binding LytR/AlgR family response regulator